jgi:hypothetical protein
MERALEQKKISRLHLFILTPPHHPLWVSAARSFVNEFDMLLSYIVTILIYKFMDQTDQIDAGGQTIPVTTGPATTVVLFLWRILTSSFVSTS